MKSLSKTLIIYIFFTSPLVVNAGLNPNALRKTTEDQNCSLKKPNTLRKIPVAWYAQRRGIKQGDNDMLPLLRNSKNKPNKKRARASFSVGGGQGVQVCPGVFLTARHNIFDSVTGKQKRTSFSIKSYATFINKNGVKKPKAILSDQRSFEYFPKGEFKNLKREEDFVFVKVNIKEIEESSNFFNFTDFSDYIPLGDFTPKDLEDNEEYTHLIRNKPANGVQGSFSPSYGHTSYKRGDTPYLVQKSCENTPATDYAGLVSTTCPSEGNVSGSFMDVVKDGSHHVAAIMIAGFDRDHHSKDSPGPLSHYGNTMVPSSLMYEDYKKACADHLESVAQPLKEN